MEQHKTQDKPEAKKAAERKELRTGEKGIVADCSERIQAYIERLENVFLNPDPKIRERNIELLKPTIHENTVIEDEDFPESHFDLQKRILKNRGISDVEFTDEQKEQEITRVQESQRKSLDAWIDYLTGNDCKYPADLKYFAMQGVLRLGDFEDKREKYSFTKRLSSTVTPFAEIDREALSVVLGSLDAVHHDKPTDRYSQTILDLINRGNSFGDLYAATMYELDQKAGKKELLPVTDGEWKVFEKGSDAQILADSLVGKRSNLCLRDIGSAETYLFQGAVEIYFSKDKDGNATVPRIAVAYAEDKNGVYEVRGTYNKNEDIDPFMEQTDILTDRLSQLPNGESFSKKDADMKKVTEIYNKCFKEDKKTGEKTYLSPELTKHDLVFLYEINSSIEGFGYQTDPRIAELRQGRNTEEDMLVLFECTKEEIAQVPSQITKNTKAYVGQLESGIFQKLPENLEHVYTSFPEKKIRRESVEIGGKTKEQLIAEMEAAHINISDYAKSMMENPDFVTGKNKEEATLIRLTVADLGFKTSATTDQIYERAQTLGLELCPPDTGPNYRLKYKDQPLNEWVRIGMKQIAVSGGHPLVFYLGRHDGGLWLRRDWAFPDRGWDPDSKFVFRLRKSES